MLDRRGLLTGTAALAAQLAVGRPALAQAREIALEERDGRFLVEVSLAAAPAPFRFVLDTGATAHFISDPLARALKLPRLETRRVRSYEGRTTEPVFALRRLRIGGVALPETQAVASKPEAMEGHDGLVGYPILGRRSRIDLQGGRLSLDSERAPPHAMAVAAEVTDRQTLLIGGPPGAEGRFVFDTGSSRCVITRAYLARLRGTEAFGRAAQLLEVSPNQAPRTVGYRLREMQFGALTVERATLTVADRAAAPEMFDGVDGLIGVDLIRRWTWTLDQGAKTLHALARPA